MATAIDETNKTCRLELLSKIDIEININDASLLTTEDGVITGLDDRYFSCFSVVFLKETRFQNITNLVTTTNGEILAISLLYIRK